MKNNEPFSNAEIDSIDLYEPIYCNKSFSSILNINFENVRINYVIIDSCTNKI